MEEKLLASREDELSPAIDTLQYSVLEFHGTTFLYRAPDFSGISGRRHLPEKRLYTALDLPAPERGSCYNQTHETADCR
ncbi:MAG: hypothetical protein JO187_12915 [Acidobacteria bacterium]|nr:hypothetical protein [Acidobacteriota bacterium]